ncbi:MAG: DUF2946 family protein [Phycisphaerales bacterium JB040]
MGRSLSNPLRWLAVLAVIASQGVLASSHLWHDHSGHAHHGHDHERQQDERQDQPRDTDPAQHDCVVCVLQAQANIVGDDHEARGLTLEPAGVLPTPRVPEPDSRRSPEPRSRGPPA